MESFTMYHRDAEEKYQKYEEERWQKDIELEEIRRREDREHDIKMMQMLGSTITMLDSMTTIIKEINIRVYIAFSSME